MNEYLLNRDEMNSVLYRLQCVHATLKLVQGYAIAEVTKPLYCVTDELMHIIDEFSDFLEEGVKDG